MTIEVCGVAAAALEARSQVQPQGKDAHGFSAIVEAVKRGAASGVTQAACAPLVVRTSCACAPLDVHPCLAESTNSAALPCCHLSREPAMFRLCAGRSPMLSRWQCAGGWVVGWVMAPVVRRL